MLYVKFIFFSLKKRRKNPVLENFFQIRFKIRYLERLNVNLLLLKTIMI